MQDRAPVGIETFEHNEFGMREKIGAAQLPKILRLNQNRAPRAALRMEPGNRDTRPHTAIPATATMVARLAVMPRMVGSGATSIHSSSE